MTTPSTASSGAVSGPRWHEYRIGLLGETAPDPALTGPSLTPKVSRTTSTARPGRTSRRTRG